MTARALAWRTMTAEPARAALAIAGVAVIGALLFDMLLLSSGLLVSFRDLLDSAGYDVRVSATDSGLFRVPMPNATELAESIAGLPEVREVAIIRRDRASLVVAGRTRGDVTLLNVSAGGERQTWRLVSGENLADASGRPGAADHRQPSVRREDGPDSRLHRLPALRAPGSVGAARGGVSRVRSRGVPVREFERAGRGDHAGGIRSREGGPIRRRGRSHDRGVAGGVRAGGGCRGDPGAAARHPRVLERAAGLASRRDRVRVFPPDLGRAVVDHARLRVPAGRHAAHGVGEPEARPGGGAARARPAAPADRGDAAVGIGAAGRAWVASARCRSAGRWRRSSIASSATCPAFPSSVHFFVFEPRTAVLHLALLAATGVAAAVYPVWIATRLPIAATLRLETVS